MTQQDSKALPITRRHLLRWLAVAQAAGLAACGGSGSDVPANAGGGGEGGSGGGTGSDATDRVGVVVVGYA